MFLYLLQVPYAISGRRRFPLIYLYAHIDRTQCVWVDLQFKCRFRTAIFGDFLSKYTRFAIIFREELRVYGNFSILPESL